jgi:hypothetical protein
MTRIGGGGVGRRGTRGDGDAQARGDARERDWRETERERLARLGEGQSLTVEETVGVLGERCVDVYLNGEACWSGVPVRVWVDSLGGTRC